MSRRLGLFFFFLTLFACLGFLARVAFLETVQAKTTSRVLPPASYEGLALYPVVVSEWPSTEDYLTLDEGLQTGQVVVSEVGGEILRRSRDGRPLPIQGGGAQVNRLALLNHSKKRLILLAGEIVSGGKQDRVIAKDRLVAPEGEPLPLDVFCVEHGRWTGASYQFHAVELMAHPKLRQEVAVAKDQAKVWAEVSGENRVAGGSGGGLATSTATVEAVARSGTAAYTSIAKDARSRRHIEPFADELDRRFKQATAGLKQERVVGVVVAYGGELAWADVFASPALFERYWSKLLRSYVVEALNRPKPKEAAPEVARAQEFLTPLRGAEKSESEPDLYRTTEISERGYAQFELIALGKSPLELHFNKLRKE
ncbi:MAG TPA: DUF6569 family protein [Candidatus Acidoferrales bacterium]